MTPGRALWAVSLLLALAPVLLVPAATTNDGPSHVYNAWVAAELEGGEAPRLGDVYTVDRRFGQTLISATALQGLGPLLGWDGAERVWLGLILTGLFLATGLYVHRALGAAPPLTPLLAAWVPLSLMTAWGFYDFLVGTVIFAGLMIALERARLRWILALLALLYLSHLFVFALGIGAVMLRSVWRKDLRPIAAVAAAGGLGLLALSRVLSPGVAWDVDWGERLAHLAFSNVFFTVSPVAVAAGLIWTTLAIAGLVLERWRWRAWLGAALLLGAAVAPSHLVGGSFLFERTHLLALLVLAPVAARASARLPRPATAATAAALLVALGATFVAWTRAGALIERDRQEMTTLLLQAGLEPGRGWIASSLPDADLKVRRAAFHAHLADRVARDLELIAADNHEAPSPAFPVWWADGRSGIYVTRQRSTLRIRGTLPRELYLLHAVGDRPEAPTRAVVMGRRFAVTRIGAVDAGGDDASRERAPDPSAGTGGHDRSR